MIVMKINAPKFKLHAQADFAMSHAINKTMTSVRDNQKKEMPTYMNNDPVAYTRNSPKIKYSNKSDLRAYLYYKTEYMSKLMDGGQVTANKSRRLIEPVNAKTMKGGQLNRNYIKNKLKMNKYFIGIPKGLKGENYRGVWERQGKGGYLKSKSNGDGSKTPKGKLRLMVSLKRSSRMQKPQFPAGKIARYHFGNRFERQLKISMRLALRTAR
jgi:hypothetical protein